MAEPMQPIPQAIDDQHHQHRLRRNRPVMRPPHRHTPVPSVENIKDHKHRRRQGLQQDDLHERQKGRILNDLNPRQPPVRSIGQRRLKRHDQQCPERDRQIGRRQHPRAHVKQYPIADYAGRQD